MFLSIIKAQYIAAKDCTGEYSGLQYKLIKYLQWDERCGIYSCKQTMSCDPILIMRDEQAKLRAMFPRASASTLKRNPGFAVHDNAGSGMNALIGVIVPSRISAGPVKNKYRNVKVEHAGLKFDSKKELQCWLSLQLRQKLGEIRKLKRQVKFELVVEGVKVGGFTPDFQWEEITRHTISGPIWETVVADCKSPPTRKETAYRLRKRIFEAVYHPLTIREL